MYAEPLARFANLAAKKSALLRDHPRSFLIGAIAGGAYVGLGILLILSVGDSMPHEYQKLTMGLLFSIALVLVVIAGAELFTGYAMYMTIGTLAGRATLTEAIQVSGACWLGNLAGAGFVATVFVMADSNGLLAKPHSLLYEVAAIKMSTPVSVLFAKAVLCNWLVCLALWMCERVDSHAAKCIVIFWCLLAFIACGFEHSVANMTVLSLAVIGHAGEPSVLSGALYNLAIVTIGNIVGGSVLVGALYWFAEPSGTAAFSGREAAGGRIEAS